MSVGVIKQSEVIITTATDTELIAAPESGQHIEVLEMHASVFVVNATGKIRFEDAAGGVLLAGLGTGDGNALGPQIAKSFLYSYKVAEAKGVFVESTSTSTWYVYAKYRLVETAQ